MSVTKDQAQMIATLAIAARPNRAPTWDAPGVMAQLGKVAHLDLAEVTIAALRLARDPYAQTPADIARTNTECWREALKPQKWVPQILDPTERCKTCGKSEHDCQRNPHGEHDFEPDFKRPRDLDLAGVVAELKGHLEQTREPSEPRPVVRAESAEAARVMLHGTTQGIA